MQVVIEPEGEDPGLVIKLQHAEGVFVSVSPEHDPLCDGGSEHGSETAGDLMKAFEEPKACEQALQAQVEDLQAELAKQKSRLDFELFPASYV